MKRNSQVATFLGLTFGPSAIFWWLIIDAGNLGARGVYAAGAR